MLNFPKKVFVPFVTLLCPFSAYAAPAETTVIYFSQFDNVSPVAIETLKTEHPEMIDARTGASLQAPGLTGLVARWAATALNVKNVHPILALEPYPALYWECLRRVEAERDTDARPPLDERSSVAAEAAAWADRIVFVVPNWSYTLPAPVKTFLEANAQAFKGKVVLPIVIHGTGGLADTVDVMKEDLPGAQFLEPLSLVREEVRSSQKTVEAYIAAYAAEPCSLNR